MWRFIVFYAFCAIPTLTNGECKELYTRLTPNHTGCKPKNPNCTFIKEGLTGKDRRTILREHNIYRNRIALGHETKKYEIPSSSNMLKIEWDKELALIAQSHASQCLFEHDCNFCREVDNFDVGQNLYTKKSSAEKPVPDWKEAIKAFYDEIKYVTNDIIESYVPETTPDVYSHFTQLVWAETWKIGCGYSAFRINESLYRSQELYTCNYGPSGNVLFEKVYDNGTAASACPLNTNKSRIYPGLCNAKKNGPQKAVFDKNVKVFLLCDFSSNCSLKLSSPNRAFLISLYSGKYLSVRLKKGQRFTITFTNTIKSNVSFCIQINHRMLSSTNGTTFEVELNVPSINWKTTVPAHGHNKWSLSKLDIKWNFETEVTIALAVSKESSMKYFDIDYIAIYDGLCLP